MALPIDFPPVNLSSRMAGGTIGADRGGCCCSRRNFWHRAGDAARRGGIESALYYELIAMLTNEPQRQQSELLQLKQQSARLQATLARQTAGLTARPTGLWEARQEVPRSNE